MKKTLYLAGDTIWCDEVIEAIDQYTHTVIEKCKTARTKQTAQTA